VQDECDKLKLLTPAEYREPVPSQSRAPGSRGILSLDHPAPRVALELRQSTL
jgi:hypothetical protein